MRYLISIFALITLTACSVQTKAPIHHLVFVWLKDSGNETQRQEIIDVSKSFREIPGVKSLEVGPVISSERKIVDDSFDLGILITFDNVAEMNAYIEHPDHKEAVKNKLKPLVKKIVVYDFEAQN